MDKKLIKALLVGGIIIILGGGALFYTQNIQKKGEESTKGSEDFQRLGQYSFGLDVCNEMTKEAVSDAIEKKVLSVSGYSNAQGTGCHYETEPDKKGTITINVGYGEAAKEKKAMEILGRRIEDIGGIGLENFAVYSGDNPEHIMDIYMTIDSMQKYVRVSKLSFSATDNEHLIALAQKTEEKIRSYK